MLAAAEALAGNVPHQAAGPGAHRLDATDIQAWRIWLQGSLQRSDHLHPCTAVSVLRHLINPLMSWVASHGELEVLSPDIVQGLVSDVFQNPEKGVLVVFILLNCYPTSVLSSNTQPCHCRQLLMYLLRAQKCRWSQRADTVRVGAALHDAYSARSLSVPRASQGVNTIWLVSAAIGFRVLKQ